MNKVLLWIIFLGCVYLPDLVAQEQEVYVVVAGDKIEIKVLGQDDLTVTTLLNKTGKINFPFLGEIQVVDLTVEQIEQKIINGLKGDYLINPSVDVQVVEYRPFFITGEVRLPGGYPYQLGLTINQAIAIAGGLTERASEEKIFLIKEKNRNDKIKVLLNDTINAGDTIIIEQRFF